MDREEKLTLEVAKNGLNGCFICHKDLENLLQSEEGKEQLSPFVEKLGEILTYMKNANDLSKLRAAIKDFDKTMYELGAAAAQNNVSDFFWSAMGTLGEYVVCDVKKKLPLPIV